MRRMERQAKQTDRAIKDLGKTMDRAVGRETTRKFNQHEHTVRKLDQTYKQVSASSGGFGNNIRRTSRDLDDGTNKLIKHGQAIAAIGKIVAVIKWPALVAGAGSLTSIVSQLAGGVTALIPQIVDLGGVVGALPSTFLGAVGAMATFKLAFSGVGAALKAGVALHQQAGLAALQTADAQYQASQTMINAERGIMLAQRGSHDAQLALTQARRDAIRNLTDLRLAAKAAALGEQGANLTLEQARLDLQRMMFQPGTTSLQVRQQQLAIQEAQLGVTQSHVGHTRAVADRNRADKLGLNQNQQVIQAVRGVADAMFQQKQAAGQLVAAQRQVKEMMIQGAGAQGAYQQALNKLTPQAREFVKTMVSYHGVLKRLKVAAGAELFPGLTKSLHMLPRALPMAERLLHRFGGVIGSVAQRATRRFTGRGFLSDFEALGNQGATGMDRLGSALISVVSAFRHIAMAARPFTDWFQKVIVRGAAWFDRWAEAGRKSGRLALSFERTRRTLARFWDMAKNVWVTLRNIGNAARPTGDKLWGAADKATRRWRDFTSSFKGQIELRKYFADSEGTVRQTMGLIGDLGKAIFRMGHQPGTANLIKQLRGMVPILERLLTTMGQAFTSRLLRVVGSVLNLFTDIAGMATPLAIIFDGFDKLVNALDWIVRHSGAAKMAIASIFSVVILDRFLKKLGTVGDRIRGVTTNRFGRGGGGGFNLPSGVTGQPQPVYVVNMPGGGMGGPGGMGPGGVGPGGGGGPAPGGRGPGRWSRFRTGFGAMYQGERAAGAGRAGSFLAGVRGGFGRPGLGLGGMLRAAPARAMGGLSGLVEGGVGATLLRGRGALGGLLKGGAGKALGLLKGVGGFAADMFLPAAAISGLIGGVTAGGSISNRARGALSGMTMGGSEFLANKLGFGAGPSEAKLAGVEGAGIQKKLTGMGGDSPTSRDLAHQVGYLRAMIAIRKGEGGEQGKLYTQLQQELKIRQDILGQTRRQQQLARNQREVDAAPKLAASFAKAYAVLKDGKRGPVGAMDWVRSNMLRRMKRLHPDGAKVLGEATLAWATKIAKGNPKMQAVVDRISSGIKRRFRGMGKNIEIVNGEILVGSQAQWRSIGKALSDPLEKAAQDGAHSFTKLQQKALGALQAMGYTKGQATHLVRGLASGTFNAAQVSATTGSGQLAMQSDMNLSAQHGFARGGRITGSGLSDNVWVAPGNKAAPGELIVNRHTENRLQQKYGVNLASEVMGEGRPHSEPMSHARGGRVAGLTGSQANVARQILAVGRGMGASRKVLLAAIETGLVESSLTNLHGGDRDSQGVFQQRPSQGWGTPAEVTNVSHAARSFFSRAIAAHSRGTAGQLAQSVQRSAFPARYDQMRGRAMAILRALGARGGDGLFHLGGIRSGLGGVPGALSTGASSLVAAGMQRRIRQAIAADNGAGGMGGMGGGGGPIPTVQGLGNFDGLQVAQWIIPELLYARSHGWQGHITSGYRPHAQNVAAGRMYHSNHEDTSFPGGAVDFGGYGKDAWPAVQDFMAHTDGYTGRKLVPGGPTIGDWGHMSATGHGHGGRIPWFGDGADFIATRPQLIGVGDGGHERVTVTPKGRGPGGIRIGKIVVENHRPGDVKKQIKDEIKQAFDELSRELDGMPQEDPEEAMR